MNVRHFLSKNMVFIVMVPTVIGAHYGWYKLQQFDELVKPEQRDKLPFMQILKRTFGENKD